MIKSKELRSLFLHFFRERGHRIVSSAPMVVKNDPTLMFTNAGMNQFKDIFLGNQPTDATRIVNSQKCLRVSGKHNDLEEVGHDTYHHTMFEMLGNWSFGDYFKKEAIEWAWEFLTSVLKIEEDRIYATIFEGNSEENLERDNEAAEYWKKCFPNATDRILNGSKKDNFWEMGDTGPCGPCSEIHIDIRSDSERKKTPGHLLVNKDHPQVIEIWNLVFIQYNRKSDGSLESLPAMHVDTGMGFERLCMVVQGKKSNYDTDIFQSIISEASAVTGIPYGESEETDIALRVVADHLRAVAFAIADGQTPSNNKAGYVIRRILRRAIRYGYTYLHCEDPFIYRLVPALAETMGHAFPEINALQSDIKKVIQQEESMFLHTLGRGIKLIEKRMEELKGKGISRFSGEDSFTLYDTFGFPVDLTELILREKGFSIDHEGFDKEMALQKNRSRNDAARVVDDWIIINGDESGEFTGYDHTRDTITISRYRKVKTRGKEMYHLVFDKTPFYAESGGQIGDSGYISNGLEKIRITDTLKENNLTIHLAEYLPENLSADFAALVDASRRELIACNHSATHLLHHALRTLLGKHVEQKGSLVTAEKLRFDFSHFEKIGDDKLKEIEALVNGEIRRNVKSNTEAGLSMEEALKRGAIALFGEKYGDRVRVVSFGNSVELCGGTHVENSAAIGLFKIVSESAVAAGIRRIEAVTSEEAYRYVDSKLNQLEEINGMLKHPKELPDAISRLLSENQLFRKKNEKLEAQATSVLRKELQKKSKIINGIRTIIARIDVDSADMMKGVASQLRTTGESVLLAAGAEINGMASLVIMASDDLVKDKGINANKLIHEVSQFINGGGGGQPFLATAGGKNPDGIDAALEKIRSIIESL